MYVNIKGEKKRSTDSPFILRDEAERKNGGFPIKMLRLRKWLRRRERERERED